MCKSQRRKYSKSMQYVLTCRLSVVLIVLILVIFTLQFYQAYLIILDETNQANSYILTLQKEFVYEIFRSKSILVSTGLQSVINDLDLLSSLIQQLSQGSP